MIEENYLGYMKYDGPMVEDGVIDTRTGARALLGFDKSVRYFVLQQRPPFSALDFPIPVRIQKGSWIATIPGDISAWLVAGGGAAMTAYLVTAGQTIAANDFKNTDSAKIFRTALERILWVVRISKHIGSISLKRAMSIRWGDENRTVLIPNGAGDILEVPTYVFQMYLECPTSILSDVAELLIPQGLVSFGVIQEEGRLVEETISFEEKGVFSTPEEDESEELFPYLIHGEPVQIEGVVTRGNEVTNSVGFRYKDHILHCTPRVGSIVRFKEHLFLPCIIMGTISREDEAGHVTEKKPKIIFDDLVMIKDNQGELFPS